MPFFASIITLNGNPESGWFGTPVMEDNQAMRFLISVIDTTSNSASNDEMAAINAFNDMLRTNGHWIYAAGVEAPASATTIDNRQGLGLVTPGPFVKTAEHQSGFWLIEAPDRAAAEALALQGSLACNRKVEVRAFLG